MMNAGVRLSVNFWLDAYDPTNGAYLGRRAETHNMVPTVGLNFLRDLLGGAGLAGLERFALGTGGATANSSSTVELTTETYRDVLTQIIFSAGTLTLKYYMASTSGNGVSYSEAALYGNGSTAETDSGTLFARATFTAVAKTSAEAWTFTWTVTFADDGTGV